jgi:O-antigen ligase
VLVTSQKNFIKNKIMFKLVHFRKNYKLSQIGVVVTLFGASTSISLVNLGYFLTLIGIIFEGNYKERILKIRTSPVTFPLLLLMFWGIVGATYSDAETSALHRQLTIFSSISLILMVILAAENSLTVNRAWAAFICGACFTLISTYLNIFFYLPWSTTKNLGWGKDHTVFYNYISQSLVFAFVVTCSFANGLRQGPVFTVRRLFWISLAVFGLVSMLFLSTGRVGLVALVAGMLYLIARRFGFGALIMLIMFGCLGMYIIWGEYGVGARFASGVQDIREFQGVQTSQTSWGARLSMYLLSFNLIAQAPLFGHGLGDYQTLAMAFYELPSMKAISGYHPHNQYLYLFVELGIVGLGLYLWLHLAIWQSARDSDKHWQVLIGIFIMVLIVDSMFHAPFWMSGERNFFFPLIGLLAAHGMYDHGVNTSDRSPENRLGTR